MVGRHRRLHGHESEQALGDSERRGSLECRVHGVSESDTTEGLSKEGRKPCLWV